MAFREVLPGGISPVAGEAMALVALAACAGHQPDQSTPPSLLPVPSCLEPYAEMARFLPLGLKSYAFGIDQTFEPRPVLIARAGESFKPPDGYGIGPYSGVEVLDFGTEAPPDLEVAPQPRRLVEECNRTTIWAGVPATAGAAIFWWAVVDRRYRVSSYDLDSLRLALSKPGNLPEILATFPAVCEVSKNADYVVCLLPRPEDKLSSNRDQIWQRPIPIDVMVVAISTASRLLVVWHEHTLPSEFSDVLGAYCVKWPSTVLASGGWMRSEALLSNGAQVRLLFESIFGAAIRN